MFFVQHNFYYAPYLVISHLSIMSSISYCCSVVYVRYNGHVFNTIDY